MGIGACRTWELRKRRILFTQHLRALSQGPSTPLSSSAASACLEDASMPQSLMEIRDWEKVLESSVRGK